MDWQQMINDLWPQVRRKHLWPELPLPQVEEIEAPVAMHMCDKQLTLNVSTCRALAAHLPATTVVEALLDHGISHYTRCPWDLNTHLQLYATAKTALRRKSLAKLATDTFIDVVANTYCVRELQTPLPEIYRHLGGGALEGAMAALYTRIWGIDVQGSADPVLIRRLARIPYLDRQQWTQSLSRFVQLLQPVLEEEGRSRQPAPPTLGHHGLESYSPEELAQGLQAFARDVPDMQLFRETLQDFADELIALGYGVEEAPGLGSGVRLDADVLYYMQLAQGYRLPLCHLPLERSGVMEPHSHMPWEVSKPVQDIDIWTSFGKLWPGLSQTWRRRQGALFGRREGTPDCLIVLDSSGSMPKPREQLSYAVLGAGCATEAYLHREAQVAVYNFSDARLDGKTILPFTRDRQAIYQGLCVYHGGGTCLRLRALENLRRTATGVTPDLLLITDMQLANLEEVIDYLVGVEGRITVIHIDENNATAHFRQATHNHPRLRIFTVRDSQDIPHIVLGQVQHYFTLASHRSQSSTSTPSPAVW
jgi:hypothetical protein